MNHGYLIVVPLISTHQGAGNRKQLFTTMGQETRATFHHHGPRKPEATFVFPYLLFFQEMVDKVLLQLLVGVIDA